MPKRTEVASHDAGVQAQFKLQARLFTHALHANDPDLLGQYLRLINPSPDDRVIDFCSGPGIVAARLEPHVRRVVCCDLTIEMLLEAERLAPKSHRIQAHVRRAPFRSGVFTATICRLSLHHVEHPEAVVREMARVAGPGGRVVLNDIVTSESVEESDFTEQIERLRDPSHTRCLRPSELAELPVRCGLRVETIEHYVSTIDHHEWMHRVYPPDENRPVVRSMLESLIGRETGGLSVASSGGELLISRRGMIVAAKVLS